GWLALVHTTANTEWSSLPISGLFVEMLRRMTALSQGVATAQESGQLAPIETADGFGRLGAPPVSARPIDAAGFAAAVVEPHHPPGFYGTEAARRALNLSDRLLKGPGTPPGTPLRPLTSAAVGVPLDSYERGAEQPLQAWLLAAALLLLATDALIALRLRGLIGRRWRPAAARTATRAAAVGALLLLPTLLLPATALAQTLERQGGMDPTVVEGTLETRLAYIATGVGEADRTTHAGLAGLSLILNRRTAIDAADPVGLDPARDELLFYPLIFWTIDPAHPPLAARAIEQLNRYMRTGGTLFVDTRDHGRIAPGSFGSGTAIGPGALRLRQIAPGLKIPSLVPVDPDHVLTKAFYLLQEFPGRVAGGSLWVERTAETNMDGVASFILAANDHVGAWAITETRQPMFPVIPGNDRQREFAYRFGVNLVMYALTGNYKADQVHVPAILERLGQ
ncbi:MAG: DUF4159 domain-containing protein, partial [Alphaproteobacteria bacterium]|nr:DUF4159 domain-containing protein [Alphaproteobacteria bacterium]